MHLDSVLFSSSPFLLRGHQVLKLCGEIVYFGVIDPEVDVNFNEVILSVEDFQDLVSSFECSPTQH